MNKTSLAALLSIAILTSVITIGITPAAFATPTINTATGNYYEYISDPDITWTEAKAAAESRTYNGVSGYLVTITTASENTFVDNLVPDNSHTWIGLSDETTEGIYAWVTGEWYGTYSNWTTTPAGSLQDYAEFIEATGKWNDTTNNDTNIDGYTVEYAPPPTQNTANGNYYSLVTAPAITWTDAKAAAENSIYNGSNGHLVTITTASENTFVDNLVPDDSHSWIGLSDETTEGTYAWVTGETFNYTNWNTGQPSAGTDKDYIEFLGSNGKWNDTINRSFTSDITGYIIEYDGPFLNPMNKHYYEFIPDNDITWTDAKTAAENSTYKGVNGHLVTITTANENTFVDGLIPNNTRAWMGLSDEDIEGQFKWVTDEPFISSNWDVNQPDNHNNNEHYVEFLGSSDKWNDLPNNDTNIDGYIIEYDTLALNPDNGHYYEYIDTSYTWWTWANFAAQNHIHNGITGHLVTITSASENDFVADLIPDESRAWIGLTDKDTEGTYKWVTGETFNYTNWDVNQPDNHNNNEHYVEFLGSSDKWNDLPNDFYSRIGYVIEYDTPALNPATGNYYEYITDSNVSWTEAKTVAEAHTYNGVAGHLVTITSASENAFVADLVPDDARTWIGFSDEDVNHSYRWVTGELYYYTNWDINQPSSDTNDDDYVEFRGSNNKWNDTVNNDTNITGYVVEYDFPLLNPENGHYYEHVINGAISWRDAKTAAETHTYNGVAGHLVTITSASENQFVKDLLPDNFSAWMGLSDENTEGTYEWVTGEPFDYSNWDVNQPDNHNDSEDYVDFLSNGKWNDNSVNSSTNVGYIIEYTPPGSIAVLNPENGRYYQYVEDDNITWTEAQAAASSRPDNNRVMHLAAITSQSENDFINRLVPDGARAWIGLSDETTEGTYEWPTGEYIDGTYRWTNTESFNYSNWDTNQPSAGAGEDYVEFIGSNGKWNDTVNNDTNITGYVVEYIPPPDSPILNLENGHYYQYIGTDSSWTDLSYIVGQGLYRGIDNRLVTITSASENQFVKGLVPNGHHAWIGLTDKNTEGTYEWVSGEPFAYTNWNTGQPDNSNNEDYVEFIGSNGKWNDTINDDTNITGYVIELVPPTLNPENGNYYKYIRDDSISWTDAKNKAKHSTFNDNMGYLATITSQSENDFIKELVPDDSFAWIGLTDKNIEGTYEWAVTGERYSYSNWGHNQPSAGANGDDYVEFIGFDGKWTDLPNSGYGTVTGYVVEYTSDPFLNPINNHYYEFVPSPGITWTDAKTAAESHIYNGFQGHLVTITSQSEDAFVAGLIPYSFYAGGWIGLSDASTEGTYQWVTGEPFNYTNWNTGQPDNSNNEDYVEFNGLTNKWNDLPNDYSHARSGYFVEYYTHALNPDNGNYYEYVIDDDISWTDAKTAAESRTYNGQQGHLVTITSTSENTFVGNLLPDNSHVWMGLTDEVTEGSYKWVTGEPYIRSNWDTNQPSAGANSNDYVEFSSNNDKWNDTANNDTNITGYVVEYDFPLLNPENGHYYEHITASDITWTEAKAAAETHRYNGVAGHLVTITSQSENDLVSSMIGHSYERLWIGLTDQDIEGDFEWVTGETFDYSNWSPGEPDGSGYGLLIFDADQWWYDINNDYSFIDGYIVEYDTPNT